MATCFARSSNQNNYYQNLDVRDVDSRLLRISDILDGYNVIRALSEEKEMEWGFSRQRIVDKDFQFIMGKNYRINLLSNGDLQFVYIENGIMQAEISSYENKLSELGYSSKSFNKQSGYGNKTRISIGIGKGKDIEEDIMKIFSVFNIK